jgi:hypothetical protein
MQVWGSGRALSGLQWWESTRTRARVMYLSTIYIDTLLLSVQYKYKERKKGKISTVQDDGIFSPMEFRSTEKFVGATTNETRFNETSPYCS